MTFFNLVDCTCPRVLVQSTWNLFRSTVYELKLCTFYFWLTSIRPSVRQNGWNIAPHSILVIFIIFCQCFYYELILGFWSDQSKTYMDIIFMGWNCAPFLGGGGASHRPFFCERRLNLATHRSCAPSINDLSYNYMSPPLGDIYCFSLYVCPSVRPFVCNTFLVRVISPRTFRAKHLKNFPQLTYLLKLCSKKLKFNFATNCWSFGILSWC